MLAHPAKVWLVHTDLDAADGYGAKMSPRNQSVPLPESKHHVINAANPRSAFYDGIEHWLHVCRRAADDAKDFGRCRLMFERLAQFCVALLDLLEQPDILDSNHGLVGESFEPVYLLLRKWTNFRAPDNYRPNRNSFSKHRRGKNRATPTNLLTGLRLDEFCFQLCRKIMDVDCFSVEKCSSRRCAPG